MKKQNLVDWGIVPSSLPGRAPMRLGVARPGGTLLRPMAWFSTVVLKKIGKKAWQLSLLEPTPESSAAPGSEPDPVLKSVNLSWQIPVLRADGCYFAIGAIGGFEIYTSAENSGDSAAIAIEGKQVSSYKVGGLPADVYQY